MPGDEIEERLHFAAAMTTAYADLHEASLSLATAAALRHVPTDPKTLRKVRRDLEKTRRLLHTCLMHVDTIERAALDLDEDEPYLP